jgi:hypothetical protein
MKFVTHYNTLNGKRNLRKSIRHYTLDGLAYVDNWLSSNTFLLLQPRIQFLYLHHVFVDEKENLIRLIELLQSTHTFISYSEAVEKILNGTIDKSYIVFSLDDGLKNNLNAASC